MGWQEVYIVFVNVSRLFREDSFFYAARLQAMQRSMARPSNSDLFFC
jgi:hypothetical protein